MARRSLRRARFLRYTGSASPLVTDITLWDHVVLLDRLRSRPKEVLSLFAECGIYCLVELDSFRRLWVENRSAALLILSAAVELGIPFDAGRPDLPLGPAVEGGPSGLEGVAA